MAIDITHAVEGAVGGGTIFALLFLALKERLRETFATKEDVEAADKTACEAKESADDAKTLANAALTGIQSVLTESRNSTQRVEHGMGKMVERLDGVVSTIGTMAGSIQFLKDKAEDRREETS